MSFEQQQQFLLFDRGDRSTRDGVATAISHPVSIRIWYSDFDKLCRNGSREWCEVNKLQIGWATSRSHLAEGKITQVIACFTNLDDAVIWKLRWGEDVS